MKHLKTFLFSLIALMMFTALNTTAMPYSTDADLYDRIDEQTIIMLTDDDNTGAVNQIVLDNKRADMHELVNTHLRGRYIVPLDPAPQILINIESDLLVHSLYTRRPNYEIPESTKTLKKDALDLLMKINQGKILLEDQPDIGEGSIVTNKKASNRLFSDDTLRSY